MKNHINQVHEKIKPYSCHLCNFATYKKYILKEHFETDHKVQYVEGDFVKVVRMNDRILVIKWIILYITILTLMFV